MSPADEPALTDKTDMAVSEIEATVRDDDLSVILRHEEEAEHQDVEVAELRAIEAREDLVFLPVNEKSSAAQRARRMRSVKSSSPTIPSTSSFTPLIGLSMEMSSVRVAVASACARARRPVRTVRVY
jgi:hypothetical protein